MFATAAIERESRRRPYETVAAPDQVPLYDLVPVEGPRVSPSTPTAASAAATRPRSSRS
jgi:hypothetical protein